MHARYKGFATLRDAGLNGCAVVIRTIATPLRDVREIVDGILMFHFRQGKNVTFPRRTHK
jgi:hypothetical protein